MPSRNIIIPQLKYTYKVIAFDDFYLLNNIPIYNNIIMTEGVHVWVHKLIKIIKKKIKNTYMY